MPTSEGIRLVSLAEREALKKATNRAIRKDGGTQSDAARHTRVRQAQLARCSNHTNRDFENDFVAVDVAVELDRLAGHPIIAKEMLAQQGYIAIPLPQVDAECADARQAAATIKELGEVLTAIGADLADGEVGNDLAQLDDVIKQGGEGLEQLTIFLQAMKERRLVLTGGARS